MKKTYIMYKILGHNFCIEVIDKRLVNKIVNHISQFCFIKPKIGYREINGIVIKISNDKENFSRLQKYIQNNCVQIIEPFENEKNLVSFNKGKQLFLQWPNKYIVKKYNNNRYHIFVNNEQDVKYLFRVIREIIVRLQENCNKFFFHGTAFEINKKGIAILGNSGSGKTTFLTSILEENSNDKVKVLSNDRIFLYKDDEFKIDFFPIPIRYKLGTVQNNIYLKNFFKKMPEYYNSFNNEVSFPTPLTMISSVFKNVSLTEKTKLNCVILPFFDVNNKNKFKIVKTHDKEKIELILKTCFTPNDVESLRVPWIYPRKYNEQFLLGASYKFVYELVKNIPVYKIEYGPCPYGMLDALKEKLFN